MALIVSQDVGAQCDPGDFFDFRTRDRNTNVSINPTSNSVNEGPISVTMPLDISLGDAGISPGDGGISTLTTVTLNNWSWQIKADTRDWDDSSELEATYRIGTDNTLTSSSDPSSTVDAVVTESRIDIRRFGRRNTRFRAYLEVQVDFANATRAGSYDGVLNIMIDCR